MTELESSKSVTVNQSRIEGLVNLIKEAVEAPSIDRTALEKIKSSYLYLAEDEKPAFFKRLLEVVEIQPADVSPHIDKIIRAGSEIEDWRGALAGLRSAVASPRLRLFFHYIGQPGGLKFLLDLRADILTAQRHGASGLEPLDQDLILPFESWFHSGFLTLKEITLDSPYSQIEIIKNNDMVHPMTSLEEMGQRLGHDRRCFALYHQAMPEEPIVFIEAALTKGIIKSVRDIIGPEAPVAADKGRRDTAVFYSINNTQNGLAGLGLGQVLIFQAVDFLKKDAPEIKQFCTLSPMPGFWRRFLEPVLKGGIDNFNIQQETLDKMFDKKVLDLLTSEYENQGGAVPAELNEILLAVFSSDQWFQNPKLVKALAKPLKRLGYIYLSEEKDQLGRPLDPVANFHLGNGATLSPQNVNFRANHSAAGLGQSKSLMVNYVYSQTWLRQIGDTMSRLGGFLPNLYNPWMGIQ